MTKQRARAYGFIIAALLIAGSAFAYPQLSPSLARILPASTALPGFYQVVEVYDGDTIAVTMNGSTEKIRLIGVDTPETHKPNTPVQCFGPQASTFTKERLQNAGNSVRLEADSLGDNRDRYDRLLRYAYLPDGTLLQETLIAQGYGFAYTSFAFEKKAGFRAVQETARANKVGLWAACQPSLKKDRWQSNEL